MRLYLIRHARSSWNLQNRIQGNSNPHLDRIGRLQSKKLAQYFSQIPIDRFYSSPLFRARQTSLALHRRLNIDIEFVNGLKEINLGLWEGKTPQEVDKLYKGGYKKWLNKPRSVIIPKAEPINYFKKRAIATLTSIIEDNDENDNLLIVTHGGVIVAFIAYILKVDFGKLILRLRLDNTGITIVDVFSRRLNTRNNTRTSKDLFITAINQTSHLGA